MHQLLNRIGLYTWSDAIPALPAGSRSADLKLFVASSSAVVKKNAAIVVQDLIRQGKVRRLVIQERLNPLTGAEPGRSPRKRQLLTLLAGDKGATAMQDPVAKEWFVRALGKTGCLEQAIALPSIAILRSAKSKTSRFPWQSGRRLSRQACDLNFFGSRQTADNGE
jgi:hypothetical protein